MSTIMNMRTTTPVNTFIGPGASRMVGKLCENMGLHTAFVVCDAGVKAAGLVDGVLENLKESKITTYLFDRVAADAPDTLIDEAAGACKEFGAQVVVAIGGCNTLGSAKPIAMLQSNPGKIAEYCLDRQRPREKGLKLILIPTTAGTGSEITRGCVVAVSSTGSKIGMAGPEFLADYALIDPLLTVCLPPKQTSATAMDAFSHCVESMLTAKSNSMCDLLSLEGIRLICQNLGKVMENGQDVEARQNMMYAAYLAGISLGDGGCSCGHGIAHVLGGRSHLPHGVLCAIALPLTVEYYAQLFPEKIRKIAEAMELTVPAEADEVQAAAVVADAIRSMNKQCGIPALSELGIDYNALPELARLITEENCIAVVRMSNPEHTVTDQDYLIPLQREYKRG